MKCRCCGKVFETNEKPNTYGLNVSVTGEELGYCEECENWIKERSITLIKGRE